MSCPVSLRSNTANQDYTTPNLKVDSLRSQVEWLRKNLKWLETKLLTLNEEIHKSNLDISDILAIYEVYVDAGIDLPQDFKQTCLFSAVRGENEAVVSAVLVAGAYINGRDHLGRTPLHIAAEMNHVSMMRTLLQKNPDVNAPMHSEDLELDGNSPLHVAVEQGHEQVVTILLEANASIAYKNTQGKTSLDLSFSGATKIFALLFAKIDDLWIQDEVGNSCLHQAAKFGTADSWPIVGARAEKESKFEQLLELRNFRGETALHLAALNGNDQLATALLGKQPNIEAEDENGMTLLHAAVCGCSVKTVEALVTAKASLEATDRFANTPFLLARKIYYRLFIEEDEEFFVQPLFGPAIHQLPYSAYAICLKDGVQAAMASVNEIYNKLYSSGNADASLLEFRESVAADMKPRTFSSPVEEGQSSISSVDSKGNPILFLREVKRAMSTSNEDASPLPSWFTV